MKKTKLFAFASSMLLLASCSNNDAPEYPQFDPIDEEGNIGYIRLAINNSDTRANTELTDAGDANESAIDHFDFLFTDVNDQPFKVHIEKDSLRKQANGAINATVKLPKMPKYVAAIVNGNGNYENITDLTKSDHAVDHYTNPNAGENQQFYMSSSRYWDNSTNHNAVYRTSIAPTQVYKSWDAAKTGTPVAITVERYVAKVNVKSELTLTDGALDPMTGDHKDHMAAKVSFKPEYIFLTGVNDKAFRVKDLPAWSDMDNMDLTDWCNDFTGKRSFWVGNTAGSPKFQTLNMLNGTKPNTETWAKWMKPYGDEKVFYPFENNQDLNPKRTSVVVAGKFTVTDKDNKSLADTDGTFYLVAFENNFIVCKTEAEAIKAMGGSATDVLVPEGANNTDLIKENGYTDAFTGWTGWMKIKGSKTVFRCVKYNGGYGYYSKEIVRTYSNDAENTPRHAIVRNHLYTINIKGIQGMGVGIPDPDQPIINIPNPNPEDQNYFLNMSVTVAPWKVVPVQDTEWK
ncbi:MAG: Mfa1 family fimbria major subunit [Muribaculaceae bacterium]|nr:Mfa1 family fimbria major subunit [Muribaculaceae bacterium]